MHLESPQHAHEAQARRRQNERRERRVRPSVGRQVDGRTNGGRHAEEAQQAADHERDGALGRVRIQGTEQLGIVAAAAAMAAADEVAVFRERELGPTFEATDKATHAADTAATTAAAAGVAARFSSSSSSRRTRGSGCLNQEVPQDEKTGGDFHERVYPKAN